MPQLTDFTSYADAQREFAPAKLWELFDGDRERLNIAHECIDRHAGAERTAVIVAHADGGDEVLSFDATRARVSSRFAHWLAARGVQAGDRVAVMLEPVASLSMSAIFGAIKRGAIAVPLFTLFGPDGMRLRVQDCSPRLLVTNAEKAQMLAGDIGGPEVVVADAEFMRCARRLSGALRGRRRAADDLAIFQYTSGTTRELPDAVKHTQRALVTLMVAALYGTGLRPGDRFFCPSSPAWGHGLWHGTLAPLALGITTGAYAGKFNAERLLQALQDHALHQPLGRGDALPHDAQLRRGAELHASPREALVHRRADRQRDRGLRRSRPSADPPAACTARPRSA